MRLCALALLLAAAPAAAQFSASPLLDPAEVRTTAFAGGLSFPVGMAELPDGSVLVGESLGTGGFFGSSAGRVTRLVDADDDGVAEARQTVVGSGLAGSVSAVRRLGDAVAVLSLGRAVRVYRLNAADPAAPLAEIGALTFAYTGQWLHRVSALAVRDAPGVPGAYDLVLQVGSATNATRTTMTVGLSGPGGFARTLEADAVHTVRVRPTASGLDVVSHAVVARGLRNGASLAFHPTTGDLYVAENGIDGLTDPNEPLGADVLHRIAAADVGVVVPDFGFPDRYVAYRTGVLVGGGTAPLVAFQPIPDPQTGAESEGPNDMAFLPATFPAALRGTLAVGFHGRFNAGGLANEENPLVAVSLADLSYVHLITAAEPGVGHLDGLLATARDLFVADVSPGGSMGAAGQGTGVVYRLRGRTPVASDAPADARAPTLRAAGRTPTRAAVRVELVLPAPAHVRADLVDALGRRVAVLAEGERAAGAHTLAADAAGLAAGVYVVRVEVRGWGTLARRVVVAR